MVSTPRHHTGVVITEYGAADLTGLTVRERAAALADIAHPDFRDELRRRRAEPSDGTDRMDRTGPHRDDLPATLTLATFNVHMGVDGWGRPFDVVGECAPLDADVLVMQESWEPDDGEPEHRRPGGRRVSATRWWPRWRWPTAGCTPPFPPTSSGGRPG